MQIAISCALILSATASAHAQWSFNLVADTHTPVPGASGTFNSFGPVSLSGGHVVFTANGSTGVYTNLAGPLTRVADTTTPVPNSSGHFSTFTSVSFDGSFPSFRGAGGGVGGVYSLDSGSIITIADNQTQIPGGAGTFSFQWVQSSGIFARRGANAAFLAGFTSSPPNGGATGLYAWSAGSLNTLVDVNTTPMPGGTGMFHSLQFASMSGGSAAVVGVDTAGSPGLYTVSLAGGPLHTIVDPSTPVPNDTGTFRVIGTVSADGPNLVFGATGGTQIGCYAWLSGQLLKIADENTPAPDGGLFLDVCSRPPSISGNNILFDATTAAHGRGLYTWRNGTISRIISEGDLLGGLFIGSLNLSTEAIDGDTIAFSFSNFNPSTGAVYTATYAPSPCSLSLLAAAAALSARRRRSPRPAT